MKLTYEQLDKLRNIGILTQYVTNEEIERYIDNTPTPGPTPTKDSRYLTYEIISADDAFISICDWTTCDPASPPAPNELTVYYSVNDGEWTEVVTSYTGVDVPVQVGDKIRFKGNNSSYSPDGSVTTAFIADGCKVKVYGNIMSLIGGDDFVDLDTFTSGNVFYNFFAGYQAQGNPTIVDVSDLTLPATTLTTSCYNSMFHGCDSFTTAPALPATILAKNCYASMFYGCDSLTTAPALPATTLAEGCYTNMFSECTSLTTAPALPATTLAEGCYTNMFSKCTSLTTAPALPATTLDTECYADMFSGCTSLTTAPALPATTLTENCYSDMFYKCTSLTTAPALPATTLAENCYDNMFNSCTSLTTAPALPATTLADYCYNSMFAGCTSLTTPPEFYIIPSTGDYGEDVSMWQEYYYYMLNYCNNSFASHYTDYSGLWDQVLNPII